VPINEAPTTISSGNLLVHLGKMSDIGCLTFLSYRHFPRGSSIIFVNLNRKPTQNLLNFLLLQARKIRRTVRASRSN
jgi:hypothetical protein